MTLDTSAIWHIYLKGSIKSAVSLPPPPPFEVMVRTTKAQYQKNLKQGKVSKTVEQMEQVMSDNKSLLYIHLVPMILGGVKVYVTILPRKD